MKSKFKTSFIKGGRVYLDYAATTPVDARVMRAMRPYFDANFGNAGSLHFFGQKAVSAVDAARASIALALGAQFGEVIFTGSATEANNLVLRGLFRTFKLFSGVFPRSLRPRIIVSAIEHESVLATAKDLEREGAEVVVLKVSKTGEVDLKELERKINTRTILVSVMYVNNEVGTIEPVFKISKIISDFRDAEKSKNKEINFPLFHTDAVQAFQYLPCDVNDLGVDFLTLSAHKLYGPKGIGALYVRKTAPISSVITGGGQEFGLRSGTENVSSILGLAEAARIAAAQRYGEHKRVMVLAEYFWSEVKKIYPTAKLNGPEIGSDRLANNLNIYFPGKSTQFLLTKLDMLGVAASSGSACSARSLTPSYVLRALYGDEGRARESIRFSLGRYTTKDDLRAVTGILKKALIT